MFLAVGYFKDYDAISYSRNLNIEIKFEAKARQTHNFAFEVSYRGKPSGLASTRAKKWVHVVPLDERRMNCYEFDVETLRKRLRDVPSLWAGDRKASEIKLLPFLEATRMRTDQFEINIDWTLYQPYWK